MCVIFSKEKEYSTKVLDSVLDMSASLSLHFLLKEGANSKMKEEPRSEN